MVAHVTGLGDRADVAIVSDVDPDETGMAYHPLLECEIVAILPLDFVQVMREASLRALPGIRLL